MTEKEGKKSWRKIQRKMRQQIEVESLATPLPAYRAPISPTQQCIPGYFVYRFYVFVLILVYFLLIWIFPTWVYSWSNSKLLPNMILASNCLRSCCCGIGNVAFRFSVSTRRYRLSLEEKSLTVTYNFFTEFYFISHYFMIFYILFKLKQLFFIFHIIMLSVNEIYFETHAQNNF